MEEEKNYDNLEQIARRCVEICEDKKAADIVLFDVRENSILADYYLVCCGTSMPHIRAIAENLRRTLISEGFRPHGQDGVPTSQWIVLDFGSILIHVMTPDMRRRYCIEDVWDKRLIVYQGGEELPEEAYDMDSDDDDDWEDGPVDDNDDDVWDDEDFDDEEFDDEDDEDDDEFDDEDDEDDDEDDDDMVDFDEDDYPVVNFDDEDEEWDEPEEENKPKRDGGITLNDLFGDDDEEKK